LTHVRATEYMPYKAENALSTRLKCALYLNYLNSLLLMMCIKQTLSLRQNIKSFEHTTVLTSALHAVH